MRDSQVIGFPLLNMREAPIQKKTWDAQAPATSLSICSVGGSVFPNVLVVWGDIAGVDIEDQVSLAAKELPFLPVV